MSTTEAWIAADGNLPIIDNDLTTTPRFALDQLIRDTFTSQALADQLKIDDQASLAAQFNSLLTSYNHYRDISLPHCYGRVPLCCELTQRMYQDREVVKVSYATRRYGKSIDYVRTGQPSTIAPNEAFSISMQVRRSVGDLDYEYPGLSLRLKHQQDELSQTPVLIYERRFKADDQGRWLAEYSVRRENEILL